MPRGVVARGAKPKKGVFSRLLKTLFKGYKWQLIVVAICMIVTSLASSSSSIFLKNIVDNLITPTIKNEMTKAEFSSRMYKIIFLMITIYLLGLIGSFVQSQLMAKVTQRFLRDIRNILFDGMQELPIRFFDTHTHGDIMSIYTNDIDSIRQLVSQSLPQVFSSFVILSVVLVAMLTFSIWLTLIVIATIIVMLVIVNYVGKNSAKYFIAQQKSLGKTEGYIEELMNGQKVVQVFCHEKESQEDFDKLNAELCENMTKANKYANTLMPILGNIGNILYVLLAFAGGILYVSGAANLSLKGFGSIEIGVILSFLPMSKMFTNNVSNLSQQINSIVMALAGADRVFTLMDEPKEVDDGYVTLVNAVINENGEITESSKRTGKWAWKHPHSDGTTTYTELKGDIRLFDVDFGYTPDKIVLHNITIYAEPGQKVAFVGATGAGKTTITNLINRFYDIADGKIRYDGININKIKKADLRKSLGVVLQETNLFTGTVMENIRYGNLNATDEEVIEAAKLANAHDFITRLPQGYNTLLTADGANLSQGQRQLLSIARAAVANAPVMILDEATSSIDTRTEKLVQQGTDQLMKGRTVFVIAHRLSTVQNSDVIMVLENGRIIERGNHQKLIAEHGKYYQLYTGAFELE